MILNILLYAIAIVLALMLLIGLIKTLIGIALELLYLGGAMALIALGIWVISRIF